MRPWIVRPVGLLLLTCLVPSCGARSGIDALAPEDVVPLDGGPPDAATAVDAPPRADASPRPDTPIDRATRLTDLRRAAVASVRVRAVAGAGCRGTDRATVLQVLVTASATSVRVPDHVALVRVGVRLVDVVAKLGELSARI